MTSGFSGDALEPIISTIISYVVQQVGTVATTVWNRSRDESAVRAMTELYARQLGDELSEVRILNMGRAKKLETFFVRPSTSRLADSASVSFEDVQRLLAGVDVPDRIEASSQLQTGARLLLLGPPGAGKSTFLQAAARQALTGVPDQRLPVFIRLREVAALGETITQFAVDQFAKCDSPNPAAFFETALRSGVLALLIDGLDEVPGAIVRKITHEIRELSRVAPDALIVVSCRDGVYDGWLPEFTELQLLPFTDGQVREFVEGWFVDKPRTAARCRAQLESAPGIRAIVSTPLLLALFCISFEANREVAPRKYEFVADAVDVLLRRWDASREIDRDDAPIAGCSASANAYRSLRTTVKEELLASIAADGFPGAGTWPVDTLIDTIEGFFSARRFRDIADRVDGRCVLRAMESQHGLVVRRGHNQYGFSHFRFYEYFAAQHLAAEDARIEWLLREALNDRRWREVVIYVASMVRDGDGFIGRLLDTVSARCAIDLLANDMAAVVRMMRFETPYTPIVTRWNWLVYWLLRIAPLATQFDAQCEHVLQASGGSCVTLLSRLAMICSPFGSAPSSAAQPGITSTTETLEWTAEALDPLTHTMRRTALPTIRELLVVAATQASAVKVTFASAERPTQHVPHRDQAAAPLHANLTTIARLGQRLEDYCRLWSIVLESAHSAEPLSDAAYTRVRAACIASRETLAGSIVIAS